MLADTEETIWRRDGFVSCANLLSESEIDLLFRVIWKHYCGVTGATYGKQSQQFWKDQEFHQTLIELRSKEPKRFGQIYDRIQTNSVVQSIALKQTITEVAARLLSDDAMCLSASGVTFRIDPPHDVRNALNWHQDQSYMPVNRNGLHGLVFWIPLQDTNHENGAIRVRVSSHTQGHINVPLGESGAGSSEQYAVPLTQMADYDDVQVGAKAGDAVVMPMNLVHASGHNGSDRIRFTLLVRFHRSLVPDFLPFRFDRALVRNAEPLGHANR
jgi:hypothetical protein